jgi:hypothetical protein
MDNLFLIKIQKFLAVVHNIMFLDIIHRPAFVV